MPWICGIYKDRPKKCRDYPQADSYLLPSCGYVFLGNGKRLGSCSQDCEAGCCRLPRINGDPEATSLPESLGGLPCKHLIYTEEKVDFDKPIETDTTEGVAKQSDDPWRTLS